MPAHLAADESFITTTRAATSNAVRTPFLETSAALTAVKRFYRITRTTLASYDSVTAGGTGTSPSGISSISLANVVTTITLNSSYTLAPTTQ